MPVLANGYGGHVEGLQAKKRIEGLHNNIPIQETETRYIALILLRQGVDIGDAEKKEFNAALTLFLRGYPVRQGGRSVATGAF